MNKRRAQPTGVDDAADMLTSLLYVMSPLTASVSSAIAFTGSLTLASPEPQPQRMILSQHDTWCKDSLHHLRGTMIVARCENRKMMDCCRLYFTPHCDVENKPRQRRAANTSSLLALLLRPFTVSALWSSTTTATTIGHYTSMYEHYV
jgi:hypothetical protein